MATRDMWRADVLEREGREILVAGRNADHAGCIYALAMHLSFHVDDGWYTVPETPYEDQLEVRLS